MNHIYRLLFDEGRGTVVVASELARAKGKGRAACRGRASAAASMLLAFGSGVAMAGGLPAPAPSALPSGGTVAAGRVAISQPAAGQMTINQGHEPGHHQLE